MSTITIGLDVGARWSEVCVLDAGHGADDAAGADHRPGARAVVREPARQPVVLEVGTHSPWVSRLLARQGHEVLVANAYQLRLIYASPRKSDRVDAETLAQLINHVRGAVKSVGQRWLGRDLVNPKSDELRASKTPSML